jgi:hypothetical protein
MSVTWENCFNGDLGDFVFIDEAAQVAASAGYEFMAWRGHVYEIDWATGRAGGFAQVPFKFLRGHPDDDCQNCCARSWICDSYEKMRRREGETK